MVTGKKEVLKVGVIGTGNHMRNNLLPNLPFLPVKVVSVCSGHIENATYYGSKYGATSFYGNYEEMIENEILDLLLCSINASEHPAVIRHAMENNIPIFIEKPAATKSEILNDLLALNRNNGVMVGFQKRFVPNYRFIREQIEGNKYGKLNYLQLEFGVGAYPSAMGIFLLEVGIHFIDLLRYFIPGVIISDVKKITSGNGRMNISVSFHSAEGAIGNLLLSSNFDWSNCHERVFANFEKMNIEVHNLVDCRMTSNSRTLLNVPLEKVRKKRIYHRNWYPNYISGTLENSSLAQSGFYPEIQYFVSSIIKRRSNEVSNLDNAYQTHLLLEKISNV